MKNWLFLTFFALSAGLFGQKAIPSAQVMKVDGTPFNATELGKTGKPIVLCFWATWCGPCKLELDKISELYEEWQQEFGVEVYAVSTDDARSAAKIRGYIESKDWPFPCILDQKQELYQGLGILSIPFACIISPDGQIVWEHTGYAAGGELEIEEELKKLVKK